MKNKHLCFGGLVSSLPVEDPILWLEVIVDAEWILEFTGCMNEDSEEKEIFILLKLFHVCEFEKTCVDVCINKQV